MSKPFILSIVGKSDSGKTTLILKLLPELKKRGYRVAAVKHCPCGFDLDIEGKDSWEFTRAGSVGVLLTSPEEIAILRYGECSLSIKGMAEKYFDNVDIVLMEGYNDASGVEKMEVVREGIGRLETIPEKVIAYVSNMELDTEKRIFPPDDVPAIADFIETFARSENGG